MDSNNGQAIKKNIIVTGASKGIGKAIAEKFASKGDRVFICSRNEMDLYRTADELTANNPEAEIKARPADLGIKEKAIDFAHWCLAFGAPDVVVNNAGLFEPGSIHNEPVGLMESQLNTNFLSAYHLTRTLIPSMIERRSGHIVNICSIAALHAYKDGGAYSVSKFALHGFSKNLREELKPFNVKVTSVHPGAVMTDSWGGFDNSDNRIMLPRDIAELVYTCSVLSPAACVEEVVVRPVLGDL